MNYMDSLKPIYGESKSAKDYRLSNKSVFDYLFDEAAQKLARDIDEQLLQSVYGIFS